MPGTEYLFTLLAPENICSGDNPLCFPFKNRHAAAAKSLQSFPTMCDPIDGSLPGSSAHGISRQEYWSGLPYPPSGDLPNPGIKLWSPVLQADSLPLSHQGSPLEQAYKQINKIHMVYF